MTKLETAQFETFCKNHIAHILRTANLSHYKLRTFHPKKIKHAMEIVTDPVYLDIEVYYSPNYAQQEFFDERDYDELIDTLCHEISHIPEGEIEISPKLQKMTDVLDPLFERFVEHTSRWLRRCYDIDMEKCGIEKATGIMKKKLK